MLASGVPLDSVTGTKAGRFLLFVVGVGGLYIVNGGGNCGISGSSGDPAPVEPMEPMSMEQMEPMSMDPVDDPESASSCLRTALDSLDCDFDCPADVSGFCLLLFVFSWSGTRDSTSGEPIC